MQIHDDTPSTAMSTRPATYARALDAVHVPPGCFPIEVVQFWQGVASSGHPYPLHWAIFVRTSPGRGNYYEIVDNADTFAQHATLNVPLQNPDLWRGSHVVGYVSPSQLHNLETHIAQVPMVRHRRDWNCQHWVYEALKSLNYQNLYTDVHLSMARLQTQMCCLLEAWEIGEI